METPCSPAPATQPTGAGGQFGCRMSSAGAIRQRERAACESVAHGKTEAVARAAHWAEALPLYRGEPASGAIYNLERRFKTRSGLVGRNPRLGRAFGTSQGIGVREDGRLVERMGGSNRKR